MNRREDWRRHKMDKEKMNGRELTENVLVNSIIEQKGVNIGEENT